MRKVMNRNTILLSWCIFAVCTLFLILTLSILGYLELGDRLPTNWRDLPSQTGLSNLNGFNQDFRMGACTSWLREIYLIPTLISYIVSPIMFVFLMTKGKSKKNILFWVSLVITCILLLVLFGPALQLDFFPCLHCWAIG